MSNRFSDDEVKRFMRLTKENLHIQDPKEVLDELKIDYKAIGHDSYRMNIRGERDASAFISLKHGIWKYKDFGSNAGGTIENVVMDATGMNYKDALNFSLNIYKLPNHLEEAIGQKTDISPKLNEEQKEKIESIKKENIQRSKSNFVSNVTSVKDIGDYKPAIEYLASRGITKIPFNMKIINGEYQAQSGELKTAFGVGVLTRDKTGADIHFLKPWGDMKSISFGKKDISFFKNPNSQKVAIFESKMDYAAAFQQMNLDSINVIIANSASNHLKVADLIKEENFSTVQFFNQNDKAGYDFVAKTVEEADIKAFGCLKYNVMSEYKQDVNDLLMKNEKISERIQDGNLEYFKNVSNSLEQILQAQKELSNYQHRDINEDVQLAQSMVNQEQSNTKGVQR